MDETKDDLMVVNGRSPSEPTGRVPTSRRTFRNSKGMRLEVDIYVGGSATVRWISPAGKEERHGFASGAQLDDWLATIGQHNGFKEVSSNLRPQKRASSSGALDAVFEINGRNISAWWNKHWRLYDGPNDPDFHIAFETHFHMRWAEWSRQCRERGFVSYLIEDDEPTVTIG